MKITEKTRCREVEHLLTKEKLEELMKLPEVTMKEPFRTRNFMDLTIKQLDWVLDYPEKAVRIIRWTSPKLLDFVSRVKGLKANLKGIEDFLKGYQTEQTKAEKKAMKGISFPDFINQILIDLIEFYHLNSVKQASRMKLKEWMLAAQSKMAKNKFQAELNKIQRQEAEAAKKNKKH